MNSPIFSLVKKTSFLFLFLLILIISSSTFVLAEERVEWNTTYSSGGNVEFNDITYNLRVSSGNASGIMLTGANETFLLGEHDCKEANWWKLCYEEKTADQVVRLVLLDLRGNISIELDFDEDSSYDIFDKSKKTLTFIVGERLDGSITFNNTGAEKLYAIQGELLLPKGLRILNLEGCTRSGQTIMYSSPLAPDEAESCTFTLEAIDQIPWNADEEGAETSETIEAKVSFTSYEVEYEETSEEYALSADKPFVFELTSDNLTQLEPSSNFNFYYYFVNNNEDKNLTIEFELYLGEHLEFVSKTYNRLFLNRDVLEFKKTLDYNESVNHSITFKIPYFNLTDSFSMNITYSFEDEDEIYFIREFPFSTTQKNLFIYLGKNLTFESGEDVSLNTTILNQYNTLSFKGYDVTVTANYLLAQPFSIRIPYSKQRTIFGPDFTAPIVRTPTNYPLTVGVIGTTEQGQRVIESKTFDITIVPIEDILVEKTITAPASLDSDAPEQSKTIFVYATNRNANAITVSFEEKLPSYIYANGETDATILLKPGKKELIYSYSVVLAKETLEELDSITAYTYRYLGENYEKEVGVFLEGLEELVTKKDNSSTQENTPTNITVTQNQSIIGTDKQEPDVDVMPLLIGSLIAFVIVSLLFIWRFVGKQFLFKRQQKAMLAQYQHLLGSTELVTKRREDLQKEQAEVKKKLLVLQEHLQNYEEKLPARINKLDNKEADLEHIEQTIEEKHRILQEKIAHIQEKDKQLTEREEELKKLTEIIEKEKTLLKHDDDLLNKDAEILLNEQKRITNELGKLHDDHQTLLKTMETFRKKHVSHHKSKLSSLATKREQLQHYHQHLLQEEAKLHREFSKVQQDLHMSQEDLKEADKIYKDVTLQGKSSN